MPASRATVPQFIPLDQLKHGQPLNPTKTFTGFTVRAAILRAPKLPLAAKAVWIMLTDKCHINGYTDFSERQLAQSVGLSLSQLKRHLRKLLRAQLLHAERRTFGENRFWLVHHPIYAFCTPLPPVTYDLPPRSHMTYPQVTYDPLSLVDLNGSNGLRPQTGTVGSSSVASGRRNGEESAATSNQGENCPELPVTDSSSNLKVSKDAKSFWYKLTPYEKSKRYEKAMSVRDRIEHFRKYLADSDSSIRRQAQHEVKRATDELRDLGFYLTAPDAKPKPSQRKVQKANA